MNEAASDSGDRGLPDPKDDEIRRLRRELIEARAREERARASITAAHERLAQLSGASLNFASSVRARIAERESFKRRLAAQYAIGRVLARAESLDEVSPQIFAILAEELGWCLGIFWKRDDSQKVLRYGGGWRARGEHQRGSEEASRHRTFACGVGLPGRVWAREEPAWTQDLPQDSSLPEEIAAAEYLKTALAFPIRDREGVVGVFELFSRDDAVPDDVLVRTVALIGDQIGQFLERRRAEEERDELLARELVARAALYERERISRELHDRVAHSIGVAHQSIQLYEAFRANEPSKAAAKLALAKKMTRAALESTRHLSMELRRSEAEEGIVPALEGLVEVAVPPGVSAELRTDGDESRVPPQVRSQIFSILREGVRNAVQHSEADHVLIKFGVTQEAATGSVEDDGRGLQEAHNNDGDGHMVAGVGLRSMKERAALLGGHLRLQSRPGGGTRVEITVPLKRFRSPQ